MSEKTTKIKKWFGDHADTITFTVMITPIVLGYGVWCFKKGEKSLKAVDEEGAIRVWVGSAAKKLWESGEVPFKHTAVWEAGADSGLSNVKLTVLLEEICDNSSDK